MVYVCLQRWKKGKWMIERRGCLYRFVIKAEACSARSRSDGTRCSEDNVKNVLVHGERRPRTNAVCLAQRISGVAIPQLEIKYRSLELEFVFNYTSYVTSSITTKIIIDLPYMRIAKYSLYYKLEFVLIAIEDRV